MWQPIHPEHAIESMRAQVMFAEELGSIPSRKVLRELERTTFVAGLTNRQPVHQLDITISDTDASAKANANPNGMIFQKHSLVREQGVVVNKLVEQVEFGPRMINFTTWRYTNWAPTGELIVNLLGKAIKIASESVAISSLRLQYIDRFFFDGSSDNAKAADLIKTDTDLVAPHVFGLSDVWHSHTGKLETIKENVKRLTQLHIDAVDLAGPPNLAGLRSISLMTGAELRYLPNGLELEEYEDLAGGGSFLLDGLNSLHDTSIRLFKSVIQPKMAVRVGLE